MIDPETALALRIIWVVPLLALTPIVAVVFAVPGAFRWLYDLRNKPQEIGTTTIYRVKPMIYVFLVIFLLINSTLGWDAIRLGRWFYFSVFGFTAALLLFALVVPYKIIIDDEGIHSHRFIGRNRTILWRELSHVEMRGQAEADTIWESAIYLFRSFGGETIVANDATTNVEDILRRIRLRHECLEQPYKRQHWYGG